LDLSRLGHGTRGRAEGGFGKSVFAIRHSVFEWNENRNFISVIRSVFVFASLFQTDDLDHSPHRGKIADGFGQLLGHGLSLFSDPLSHFGHGQRRGAGFLAAKGIFEKGDF
jgi:hypothetical protein